MRTNRRKADANVLISWIISSLADSIAEFNKFISWACEISVAENVNYSFTITASAITLLMCSLCAHRQEGCYRQCVYRCMGLICIWHACRQFHPIETSHRQMPRVDFVFDWKAQSRWKGFNFISLVISSALAYSHLWIAAMALPISSIHLSSSSRRHGSTAPADCVAGNGTAQWASNRSNQYHFITFM